MKEYNTAQIRNVGLVGHGGSGKTSLAEAFLFKSGAIKRKGSVDDGSSASDYFPDEIAKKNSITLSLLQCEWKNTKINLIDMPGFADFNGEVVSGLKVSDTALLVVDAVNGVEGGTERHFRMAENSNCSRVFFINKMDKENANAENAINGINEIFGNRAVPVQLPIGAAVEFKGVVDILKMKAFTYADGEANATEIPGDMQSTVDDAREKLIEAAAESDDALMEKYFESGELTEEEVISGLKKGIASGTVYPVFVGSSTQDVGIDLMLDFLSSSCPSPADKSPVKAYKGDSEEEIDLDIAESGPNALYIFKTISIHHVGEISLFKVYSGSLASGAELTNPRTGTVERFNQLFALTGKNRSEINKVVAGDLAASVKLKDSHTGDTLVAKGKEIRVIPPDWPKPLHRMAIVSKKKGEEDKVSSGLAKLHEEDPTFYMVFDPDIKQTIVFGQGEMHLDVNIARMKERFGVDVELLKPKIPYRETIRGKSETQGKFKRQSGGKGQYGDCWLKLEPLPRGEGFEFVDAIVGGVIPSKFIPAVEKGIVEAMEDGELAGCRVVDIKVTCYDGSYHDVDSSEMAFKIAASMGFKKAFDAANPVLLEPIYNVVITVPDDFTGDVMGDVSSRRGKVQGMEPDGKYQVIKAQIPLAELYKYDTSLRSITQGRGTYTMDFSHYEEAPFDVQAKIVEEHKAEKEAEN
ncbi:MAG: elongation factor G [candidate division Zixibacteria bacterium]|nr:elongation factor G [candidate division Zixibacteria bacterium]